MRIVAVLFFGACVLVSCGGETGMNPPPPDTDDASCSDSDLDHGGRRPEPDDLVDSGLHGRAPHRGAGDRFIEVFSIMPDQPVSARHTPITWDSQLAGD